MTLTCQRVSARVHAPRYMPLGSSSHGGLPRLASRLEARDRWSGWWYGRLREVTVARVDRLLKTVREHHGVSVSRATRNVLSGMFGLAPRHDAVPVNPVRDAAPLRAPAKEKHALTLDEVRDLRARLAADQRAVDWDLPDLVDIMLATGLRYR